MQKILRLANDGAAGAEVVGLQTRQLLYAVHKADTEALAKILSSSQATQKAIHEIDCRYDPQGSTVLSVAIHLGQAEIIKALLDYCEPLSLAVAVQEDFKLLLPDSEEAVRTLSLGSLGRFPEWWSLYQPKDPSAIALRALLDSEGNGEAVFHLLMNHGLQITDAADCDIGRCLWFWAVRKGYTSVVEEFLKNNFPIGLRSSRTGYHHLSLSFEKTPSELSRYSASREYEGLAPLSTDAIWNASQTGHLQVLSLFIKKSAILYSKKHESCANDEKVSLQSSDHSTARIEYSLDPFLAVCDRYADRKQYNDDDFPESRETEYISVIGLLLKAGADPNIGPIRSSPLGRTRLTSPIDLPPDLMPIIIRLGNLQLWDLVDVLLEHGADLRSVGLRGRSLAHCAVEGNNINLLSSLLGKGLEANAQDSRGFSLVQEAVRSGSRETLQFLIQNNANVNSVARNGTSALILAIDKQEPDFVRDLLQAGADVNQSIVNYAEVCRALREEPFPQTDERYVSFSASTPLLAAVNINWTWKSDDDWKRRQDTQSTIVDILLDNGAIPELGGFIEMNRYHLKYPISLAVTRGHVQSLRHLIRAIGPRLTRLMIDDAMRAACVMQYRFVKHKQYWRSPYTELSRSVESTGGLPLDETNILLDAGAYPNVVSHQGLTPLHVACTAKPSQVTLVKRLIQHGADVNIKCPDGKTALHYAAMCSPETLPILLDAGAHCPERDDDPRSCGWNAMQYACAGPNGFVAQSVEHLQSHHWEDSDVVRFVCAIQAEESIPLITRMVDSNWPLGIQDGFTGETPVHIGCKNRSDGPLQLICRKPRPWYVYAIQTLKNETPLILAAKNNSAVKIDLLLRGVRISEKVDLDKVYHGGPENRAFTKHACSFIDDGGEPVQEPASLTSSPTMPNKLSLRERSFILNAQDPWGWTALHHAADHGNEAMLRLLVAEPNIDLEPPVKRAAPTPMALAKATGNTLAVTMLTEAKASRAGQRKKREEDKMMQSKVKSPNRQDATKRLVLALKIAVVSICVAWLWNARLFVGSLE